MGVTNRPATTRAAPHADERPGRRQRAEGRDRQERRGEPGGQPEVAPLAGRGHGAERARQAADRERGEQDPGHARQAGGGRDRRDPDRERPEDQALQHRGAAQHPHGRHAPGAASPGWPRRARPAGTALARAAAKLTVPAPDRSAAQISAAAGPPAAIMTVTSSGPHRNTTCWRSDSRV